MIYPTTCIAVIWVLLFHVILVGVWGQGSWCFWLFLLLRSMPVINCLNLKVIHCTFTGQISQAMALALPFLACAWQMAAPSPSSDTWQQTHRNGSYTKVTASHRPLHNFLVMVPLWRLRFFGFSEFPCKLQLFTPTVLFQ